jgi:two-component system sensor histidine kinase CpxA
MADRIETLLSAERRLLQDVSHELRSPLARLGFAVELARGEEEREEALARVRKEADRMTALVGELLQLTRIEGDPAACKWSSVALDHLLEEIVDSCNLEAVARKCRLVLWPVQPAVMSGERELLHRAVENIVRNAIRHAPEATAVEIGLELRGETAFISVRDHGSGVPDTVLTDIFKPFFRVEDDRSRASGGVGLGLTIARRAVEIHQGKIDARNALPGLEVTISLPHSGAPTTARAADSLLPA